MNLVSSGEKVSFEVRFVSITMVVIVIPTGPSGSSMTTSIGVDAGGEDPNVENRRCLCRQWVTDRIRSRDHQRSSVYWISTGLNILPLKKPVPECGTCQVCSIRIELLLVGRVYL